MVDEFQAEDQKLIHELRSLTESPAPGVRTSLDQVVRQGKRRVLWQRTGAVAGVVAVVAGITFGAEALRGMNGDGSPLPVAAPKDSPTSQSQSAEQQSQTLPGYARVDIPAPKGTTVTRGADSSISQWPSAPVDKRWECMQTGPMPGGNVPLPSTERSFKDDLIKLVNVAVPGAKADSTGSSWFFDTAHSSTPVGYRSGPYAYADADVSDAKGAGSLHVQIYSTQDRLEDAANREAYAAGVCSPPQRRVVSKNGPIVQLYEPSTYNSTPLRQEARVYTYSGRVLVVTAASWGVGDTKGPDGSTGVYSAKGGRGSLPMSAEQLVNIAEVLGSKVG